METAKAAKVPDALLREAVRELVVDGKWCWPTDVAAGLPWIFH